MGNRLDRQRTTKHPHKRRNVRTYKRGYTVTPHVTWGETGSVYATGATAGIPGSWTPAGSLAPASPADVLAGNPPITASPAGAWTTGQYAQTQTAGAGGRVYWNSTAWVAGTA